MKLIATALLIVALILLADFGSDLECQTRLHRAEAAAMNELGTDTDVARYERIKLECLGE